MVVDQVFLKGEKEKVRSIDHNGIPVYSYPQKNDKKKKVQNGSIRSIGLYKGHCAYYEGNAYCELCKLPNHWLNKHHLKPRELGYTFNDGCALLCNTCHDKIHELISNHDLVTKYYTIKLLRGHPKINQYIIEKHRNSNKVI